MADVTTTRPSPWRGVLDRIEAARRGDSSESLAAVFVLAATVIALVWANSPGAGPTTRSGTSSSRSRSATRASTSTCSTGSTTA